jgi:Tat protein secretion system quality control protein TatD with DNase activity
MASAAEKSLVLTETDAPVAYGPLGEAAGPSLIPSVVFKLAELWGVSFDEAREITVRNAARFLGASEKG